MTRLVAITSLALLLGGCDLVFGSSGDGVSGFAPRVLASSPDLNPQLGVDGSLEFRVEGEDEDTLNLTWSFFADDRVEEAGSTGDGTFLAVWRMEWTDEISDSEIDVGFEVSDGVSTTDLNWAVTVD